MTDRGPVAHEVRVTTDVEVIWFACAGSRARALGRVQSVPRIVRAELTGTAFHVSPTTTHEVLWRRPICSANDKVNR